MSHRPAGFTDEQYISLLSQQLQEAEDVLEAIRTGSVDALFIQGEEGETVYTLDNADKPYRLLVEQMQEGAVTISGDGTILYANRRFSEMLDCALTHIFGQTFQQYVSRGDLADFNAYLAERSGKVFRKAFKLLRADEQGFPGYVSFSQLPSDFSGEPVYCGVITDLTEQKLLEARLHQAQKMEALGQLTGGLAHDFNNLLQAIQGSFDLIIRRPDSEKILRWAESGLKVADRGAKLTSQLLAFSRSQKLELKSCSVNQVILGMSDLLHTTLGGDIELDLILEDSASLVLTDPIQLELAILNLAINGRDAMRGSGHLTIATSKVKSHEFLLSTLGFIEIRVTDTGVGMSEETRLSAFNPFFTTKDVGQGTGLGLSQVESIIQQSSGSVAVQSAIGMGTTIVLTVPCTHASSAPFEDVDPDVASTHSKLRVLVIDDDEEVRGTFADMLDVLGHVGVQAENGYVGISKVGVEDFDLILLDFAMPVMNGAEVAKEIHRLKPGTPIVFVSGYSDTDQLRAVMNDHTTLLRKPFTIEGLRKTMEAMLVS